MTDHTVRAVLRQKISFAKGRMEAINFAIEHDGDIAQLHAAVQSIQDSPESMPASLTETQSEMAMTVNFREGYRSGLAHCIKIIEAQESSEQNTLLAVRREKLRVGAQLEAFEFSAQNQGDTSLLQTEIERSNETISYGILENPQGPMAPNASPRLYQDGYIEGLKEAIEIITNVATQK